jgi:hypothetical protein
MRVSWDCRLPTGRRNTGARRGRKVEKSRRLESGRQEGSQCHLRQAAHQVAAGLAKAGRREAGGRAGLGVTQTGHRGAVLSAEKVAGTRHARQGSWFAS